MKSIANRTGFALILACILLFGVLTFSIRYFLFADRWVSFTGSPHVYTNGKLNTGEIVDRSGEVLYTSARDRTYADSAALAGTQTADKGGVHKIIDVRDKHAENGGHGEYGDQFRNGFFRHPVILGPVSAGMILHGFGSS